MSAGIRVQSGKPAAGISGAEFASACRSTPFLSLAPSTFAAGRERGTFGHPRYASKNPEATAAPELPLKAGSEPVRVRTVPQ